MRYAPRGLEIGHFLRHLAFRPPVEELTAREGAGHHADAVEPAARIAAGHANEERADVAAQRRPGTEAHQRPAQQAPYDQLALGQFELELLAHQRHDHGAEYDADGHPERRISPELGQAVVHAEKHVIAHVPAELVEHPCAELALLARDIPVPGIEHRAAYARVRGMAHLREQRPEVRNAKLDLHALHDEDMEPGGDADDHAHDGRALGRGQHAPYPGKFIAERSG